MLLVMPLMVGFASDPRTDAAACPGQRSSHGDPPDLVDARAQTDEGGHGLVVTLTFTRPLIVPDTHGHPFRVDVLLDDPSAPTVSFHYYRHLNRILRFDATVNAPIEIYLLPEHGRNIFYGATVSGRILSMHVPGRLITRDVDIAGPALMKLRWGVIVRDGSRCDLLRSGRPVYKVDAGPGSTIVAVPPESRVPTSPPGSSWWPWVAAGAAAIVIVALGILWVRRRRSAAPADQPRAP